MNRVTLGVLGAFVLILILTGILAYVFRDPAATTTTPPPATATSPAHDIPLIGELFGSESRGPTSEPTARWEATPARIGLRFALASVFGGSVGVSSRRGPLAFSS